MIPQALSLGKMLVSMSIAFGGGKKGVEDAKKIIDGAAATYNVLQTGNIAKTASKTLISPLVAIENTLLHQDYMTDLMTVINLRDIKDVLAHYAQQGQVNGIRVSDLVEQIQPRRAGFLSMMGAEAFGAPAGATKKPSPQAVTVNGKQVSELNEYVPLAVGRTVDVSVNIDGSVLTWPLTFRQTPVPISANDLQMIFEAARPEDGWKARVFMYGGTKELTAPEFFGGEDVIKREFKIRRNDLSGYYTEVQNRATNNAMAALRTGVISMNTQANTIILSSDTARNIELELGVRFDGNGIAKIRKAVLANTIVVVDDAYGIFTFYYSGNNVPEVWTLRQLTSTAKKDTSMDLNALAKLFGR